MHLKFIHVYHLGSEPLRASETEIDVSMVELATTHLGRERLNDGSLPLGQGASQPLHRLQDEVEAPFELFALESQLLVRKGVEFLQLGNDESVEELLDEFVLLLVGTVPLQT